MIQKMIVLSLLALAASTSHALEVPPVAEQIAAAILAAPEDRRREAAVVGWKSDGSPVTLREGTNNMVCLSNNPAASRYSVACYHKDLEPFMARGRELSVEGINGRERTMKREQEVADGILPMPREARTLYVLSGDGFDPESGQIESPYLRYVIYVPYATPESTGLSTKGSAGTPWLMNAGTAGAHIMINPPR